MNWRHFVAEIECTILGHVPSNDIYFEAKERAAAKGVDVTTMFPLIGDDDLSPVVVKCHYANGVIEKVADDTCGNCGHFLINGVSRMRRRWRQIDLVRRGEKRCVRCGTSLDSMGFCKDMTCQFNNHIQSCPVGWNGHGQYGRGDAQCICKAMCVLGYVKTALSR